MPETLLEPRGLDSTRATKQDRPIGVSAWPELAKVQNYAFKAEAVAPDEFGLIASESFAFDVRPKIQIVFPPKEQGAFIQKKQDTYIQLPEGASLFGWLRNQYVHGVIKDVPKLTADRLRTMVTHSSGLCTTLPYESDSADFRSILVAQLLDESIEDGVAHPAEVSINKAFHRSPSACLQTLSQVLRDNYRDRPSLCASVLRCIGRMSFDQAGHWGLKTANEALYHNDVEIRDAAIRALEKWGGNESVRTLRQHRDSEDWLNDYVMQVILDLTDSAV